MIRVSGGLGRLQALLSKTHQHLPGPAGWKGGSCLPHASPCGVHAAENHACQCGEEDKAVVLWETAGGEQ